VWGPEQGQGTQIRRLCGKGMSEDRRPGRVSTRGKGACLGQAGAAPPRRGGWRWFQRKPLFLFCPYQFVYDSKCSTAGRRAA